MDNVVDLSKVIKDGIDAKMQRNLDAQASYTALVKCLQIIEMNGMPELRNVKAMMRRTILDMVRIGNG
jgi:hypothetical protein